MKDILLLDGDIVIENLDIALISKAEELAQCVQNILGIRLGEFIFEKNIGLDRSNLIGKNFHEDYLKQDISHAIKEQDDRIIFIDNIKLERKDRKLFVKFDAKGTGDIELEVKTYVE